MIDTGAAGVTDTGLGLAGVIGGAFGGEFSAGPVESGFIGGGAQLEGGGAGAETDRVYAGPITVVGTLPVTAPPTIRRADDCPPGTHYGMAPCPPGFACTQAFTCVSDSAVSPGAPTAPTNPLQGILSPITGAIGGAGRQFGQGTLGTTYRAGAAAAQANPLRTLAIIALLGAVAYILYKRYYKKGD